jgi:hypothetical protein
MVARNRDHVVFVARLGLPYEIGLTCFPTQWQPSQAIRAKLANLTRSSRPASMSSSEPNAFM